MEQLIKRLYALHELTEGISFEQLPGLFPRLPYLSSSSGYIDKAEKVFKERGFNIDEDIESPKNNRNYNIALNSKATLSSDGKTVTVTAWKAQNYGKDRYHEQAITFPVTEQILKELVAKYEKNYIIFMREEDARKAAEAYELDLRRRAEENIAQRMAKIKTPEEEQTAKPQKIKIN